MQNVTINSQKCGIDHESKISLTNGSLVIHRNRLGDVHSPVSLEETPHRPKLKKTNVEKED